MERYFALDSIQCKLYSPHEMKKLILFVHGFTGHKDNGTAQSLANEVADKGCGVLIFNLPAHGDDAHEIVTLRDCLSYLDTVVRYAQTCAVSELNACATSFGGYLLLRYIALHGNPFRKIVFRAPALNMYDALRHVIMDEQALAAVQRGEVARVGFDRKVGVDAQFLHDLQQNDVQTIPFHADAHIVHGACDEVVSFAQSAAFAAKNGIPFTAIENANHRFEQNAPLALRAMVQALDL